MNCKIKDGELIIFNDLGEKVWKGLIDGYKSLKAYPIPETKDFIVLLDYYGGPGRFNNLLRMDSDGGVVWKAELLKNETGKQAYSDVSFSYPNLEAYNFLGYLVKIDVSSGKIISYKFTK